MVLFLVPLLLSPFLLAGGWILVSAVLGAGSGWLGLRARHPGDGTAPRRWLQPLESRMGGVR